MIKINLAPAGTGGGGFRLQLRLPTFNLGLLFLVVYGAVFLGVGWYWWSLSSQETQLARDIDVKTKELTALKATVGEGAKVKERLAEVKKRVEVIEGLSKSQPRPILLVDAVADAIPRDLWITGLEDRGPLLRVMGAAFSPTAVSDLMANLRSSGKFKEVDLVVSRQDLTKTPSLVTFEVTCRFET